MEVFKVGDAELTGSGNICPGIRGDVTRVDEFTGYQPLSESRNATVQLTFV